MCQELAVTRVMVKKTIIRKKWRGIGTIHRLLLCFE
jgi:hypothetical protein